MYMCMFMCMHKHMHMYMCRCSELANLARSRVAHAHVPYVYACQVRSRVTTRAPPYPVHMSRRQRSAPKANISPSVRLGLTSIVAGNEAGIRTMLSAAASDDLVEKLVELHVERGLQSV